MRHSSCCASFAWPQSKHIDARVHCHHSLRPTTACSQGWRPCRACVRQSRECAQVDQSDGAVSVPSCSFSRRGHYDRQQRLHRRLSRLECSKRTMVLSITRHLSTMDFRYTHKRDHSMISLSNLSTNPSIHPSISLSLSIVASAQQTFLYGGYYRQDLSATLSVLSINTIIYSPNHKPSIDPLKDPDPLKQFQWLREQLDDIHSSSRKYVTRSKRDRME